MRKESLITGEYYHIYNRGVDKRDIFGDMLDIERFKESIKQFNRVEGVGSLRDIVKTDPKGLEKEQIVQIVALTLNPNHFHFLLKQTVDGGIAKFMQKLLAGYTKYFNDKNDRSGSLLQGTFKSKRISHDAYFKKIFPYVSQNYLVHEIPEAKQHLVFSTYEEYAENSFDFVSEEEANRIMNMFDSKRHLERHCKEIISIIRKERGKKCSLEDADDLPAFYRS